ncbi:MAG: competence/damage-inducible protein A [Candidatus Latescibacterota bacterium]|nr:MAG: competence/damage-inducible protein A [Candidatus Latescibacterota bacterium]
MEARTDVELILIGNELLRGDRRDSHLEYAGRRLLEMGVRLGHAHVVGDNQKRIAELIRERGEKTSVLVVTGGLGPTHDDITREAVAEGLGVPLEFEEEQWTAIQNMFTKYGWRVSESNRRQAFFPKGATPIVNERGTAPGFSITKNECLVVVLPGPPREFQAMFDKDVLPMISHRFKRPPLIEQTLRTTGIGESKLTPIIEPLLERYDQFTIASLPHVAGVDLLVRAKPGVGEPGELEKTVKLLEGELRRTLGTKVYATGDVRLEAVIGERLAEKGETIAVAESLTGGLLGKRLTDISGSSRYVLADVVAYSNDSKLGFLGVRKTTLVEHGAVSEEVCREMAEGIRAKTGSTYGLATTGIAGPTGGTDEKPVGLCFYGLSWRDGSDMRKRVFPGTREDVRARVVWASLFMLYEKLC